jgi:diguanylate cyclase (GGDEF)-like protein
MEASSLTSRLRICLAVRDWRWWQLPVPLRCYVAAVPLAAAVLVGVSAAYMDWQLADLGKFVLLMCCGVISVGSTPRIMYSTGGVTKDFTTVWVLPTAILLPPVYAALVAIPIFVVLQLWVHRGVVHRTVFTAGSISLCYAAVSLVFRAVPASIAGPTVGSGIHAFTWAAVVAGCYVVGGRLQVLMIAGAVKLTDPQARVLRMEWNRDSIQGLLVELDLGVLITLAMGLSPALVFIALPTVLLVRRFLVHPWLVAQSRMDSKTGLLNVATWEREAELEISRSVRMRHPVSLAILDIDHFKRVNDNHGHLVGDRVLRAVADGLKAQSRDYDKVGRFGGEEFVLLLSQADEDDACKIAERIRAHIGNLAVPVDDHPGAECVGVTISIGVSAMERGEPCEFSDLLTAADSALYEAKQAGRDRVCRAGAVRASQLVVEIASTMESVRVDPAAASLCLSMSLYAFVTER